MNEKEKKHYHAPLLTKLGKVSQITAGGTGSQLEGDGPVDILNPDPNYERCCD